MSNHKTSVRKMSRREEGMALLTTILLLLMMSSLLVGFTILIIGNQQLSGAGYEQTQAFYGAEAGMEQMTASLGNLFSTNYGPSIGQINAISAAPPYIPGIQYLKGDGSNGYTITPQTLDANGNPAAFVSTIKSGPYIGMSAMATEYTLVVNARTPSGQEVALKRTTQTVGIPIFQFGIFSDQDLSFFPGPNFNFGGRTHTNGNLYLAAGSTLTLADKVDAYKDVIRTNLANGFPTASNYGGTVNITKSPGSGSYRALGFSEGSLTGSIGSGPNPNWSSISLGSTNYAGNLTNGRGSAYPNQSTGSKQLNLGIVTIGGGATQPVDIIRRPYVGESGTVTAERYYSQASLKILLSDNPQDIMNLPCIDPSHQPFDLSQLAQGITTWPTSGDVGTLQTMMGTLNTPKIPLAASGATTGATAYNATNGYWLPSGFPIIKGYIKIEAQTSYATPCGNWQDVTLEILSLGYVGRNLNPVSQSFDGNNLNPQWAGTTAAMEGGRTPSLPLLPTAANVSNALTYQNGTAFAAGNFTGPSTTSAGTQGTCLDPHPNAVIRLERIRDNPSSVPYNTGAIILTGPNQRHPFVSSIAQVCGVDPTTGKLLTGWSPTPTDVWPNTILDPREATLRDFVPPFPYNTYPTANGVMHYIELDAKNLTKWFAGLIGSSGPLTKDPVNSPNNFVIYVSDRRGNYVQTQTWTGSWPPLSPTLHETGEYGWTDFANGGTGNTGCPNNTLDPGEDVDTVNTAAPINQLFTYGANNSYTMYAGGTPSATDYGRYGMFNGLLGAGAAAALNANPICAAPGYASNSIWPMVYITNPQAARENPPLFFRRALKIVNGNDLTSTGSCPNGVACGLTIATENPAYVQGDFNANSAGGGFNDPGIATSIVADAVTLLSGRWNDINSFSDPYNSSNGGITPRNLRNGNTTYYRTAIVGGKGPSFPQPNGTGQDFGTDGGVHNFLRYIEAWGGTLNYRGSIVSLYYNRQLTGVFKCCTVVYQPPTRGYNFDTNFLNPTMLPPRTPLFRDVNTTGFTRIMQPGVYQ